MTNLDKLATGPLWYLAFLFSTVAHEAAHAWTAKRLGDPTAYHEGQASLDPRPHLRREPMGTVFVPMVTYVLSGWMMGWASAPYDPVWAERYPRKAAWMALAGPLANLGIAVAAGCAIRAGLLAGVFEIPASIRGISGVAHAASVGPWDGVAVFLSILFGLNLLLFILNLIPLHPLDGGAAIALLMNEYLAREYRTLALNPTFSMVGLLVAWQIIDPLFRPVLGLAVRCLYPEAF